MSFEITNYSSFASQIQGNANLQVKLWQAKVRLDRQRKNALREFVGGDGSKMPIVDVTDLQKDAGDTVIINTVAPLHGRGVLGESTPLKDHTVKLYPGAFPIVVDALRHAGAWSMLFKLFAKAGKNAESLTAELLGQWLARREEDDYQWTLLRTGRLVAPGTNLFFVNNRADQSELKSTDLLNLTTLGDTKSLLVGLGAEEFNMSKDESGAEIPGYMFFGPDQMLTAFRTSATVQQAFREADMRGSNNRLFTGKYGIIDGTVLYPHHIQRDPSAGRQGSPLCPDAFLGTEIADGTPTALDGGYGSTAIDDAEGDYFANFPGYLWKITSGETPPADSGIEGSKHYAMIYNISGADKDKYEIVAYTTGNNGKTITSVTRGSTTTTGGSAGGGNVTAQAASRFTLAHPAGSRIFPCTRAGVPLVWGLGLGANALMHARGKYDAQPIEHGDDFKIVGGNGGEGEQWWLKAKGILSIRGIEPYKNTVNAYTNFVVVCGARVIPGIKGPEPVT